MSLDDPAALEQYQWKHRLLLLFAPSPRAPNYEQQVQLLADCEDDLDARDLLVFHLFQEGQSRLRQEQMDEAQAAMLRTRFGVGEDDFQLILIEKDGTEQRRDDTPVKPEALFEQIDALPIRQRELREGGAA